MQDLIERFTTWALDQADVRSAIIVRSQARADRPADKLSDLDLAVIVTDPSIYLFDTTWLREFGEPCLTFVESTAVGIFSRAEGLIPRRSRRRFFNAACSCGPANA